MAMVAEGAARAAWAVRVGMVEGVVEEWAMVATVEAVVARGERYHIR